jgi:hypothetical protein
MQPMIQSLWSRPCPISTPYIIHDCKSDNARLSEVSVQPSAGVQNNNIMHFADVLRLKLYISTRRWRMREAHVAGYGSYTWVGH